MELSPRPSHTKELLATKYRPKSPNSPSLRWSLAQGRQECHITPKWRLLSSWA